MTTHQQLVERLIRAAETGQNLLPLSLAEQEHVRTCTFCAGAVKQLLIHAVGEEVTQAVQLIRQADRGELLIPLVIPQFDLSFLKPAGIWESVSDAPHNQSLHSTVRTLAATIRLRFQLYQKQGKAMLDNLSTGLFVILDSPGPEPAIRSESEGAPVVSVLALPDPQNHLQVVLRIAPQVDGHFNLTVELQAIQPEQAPADVEMVLRSKHGTETAIARNGQRSFIHLSPDEYIIEIQLAKGNHKRVIWHVPFTLERRRNSR
jgi:hypothetical protein